MMIRPFTRVLSAAVVVLALALILASPAQAGPVKAPRLTKAGSNFLDAALSWLNGFLTDLTPAAPQRTELTKAKPTGSTSGGGGITPHTGSCIDPQGEPCVVYP